MGSEILGIRYIYGRAGTGKSYTCIEEIEERLKSGEKKPLILIVPEQLSFKAEKALIEKTGATGINNVHVLSFQRLAFTIFNEVGGITRSYMDDTGKAIIIGKVIQEVKQNLKLFNKAVNQMGFIDKIIDTLTEFKRHNVTPQMLKDLKEKIDDNELLTDKLEDIWNIYNEFENKLTQGYFDPEDNLTILYSQIGNSEFLKGAEIWMDEFNGFTPQQYNIIGALLKQCKNINITIAYKGDEIQGKDDVTNAFYPIYVTEERLTELAQQYGYYPKRNLHLDTPHRFKDNKSLRYLEENYFNHGSGKFKGEENNISIFKAQNPYSEIEFIAKEVLRLVREEGFRYRDILIVCRDLPSYKDIAKVIFSEYEIPNFVDDKEGISGNPLIIYITSLLDIFLRRWKDTAIITHLKSGFINLQWHEVDMLENYLLEYGIKSRKKWIDSKYWKENPKYEGIENIRGKVLKQLLALEEKIKNCGNVKELCTVIFEYLNENEIYEKINYYINKFMEENNQQLVDEYSSIWNVIIELLDQFVEILGEEAVDLEEFTSLLNMGISHHKMGLIPPVLDQVIIGSAERIKAQEVKVVMIIGVNDGVLPRINNDEGLFNDRDRISFVANGISVAKNSFELVFSEQFLIYSLLSLSSDFLYLTYPIADLEGKTKRHSMVIPRIKSLFQEVKELTDVCEILDGEDKEEIVAAVPTFNTLVSKVSRYIEDGELSPLWNEVYKYYIGKDNYKEYIDKVTSGLSYDNYVEIIAKNKAKQLYGSSLSVSKLEAYARCSFSYFIKYGLKAKERKIYTFAPLDFGNVIHEGLEKFSKIVENQGYKWGSLTDDLCESILDRVMEKILEEDESFILKSSKRYEYIVVRVRRILLRMVTIINEQMGRGDFLPIGYEVTFGPNVEDRYPPIIINLSDGEEIRLQGKIDRIDKGIVEGTNCYRVIDYKTGDSKLDINDIYNGIKLQLITYLDAILTLENKINHDKVLPGAMLYLGIDDPIIKEKKALEKEALKEEILKALKMKGLVIKDLKIVSEMDSTIEEGGTSSIIPISLSKPKKKGEEPKFSERGSSTITLGGFNALRVHTKDKIKELCEDMLNGVIHITPCKNGDSSSCGYCEFSSICQFDNSLGINEFRVLPRRNPKELIEYLERQGSEMEGDNHGE